MKKLIVVIVLAAAAIGITYAVQPRQSETPSTTNQPGKNAAIVMTDYVRYPGEDGKNALELLKKYAAVETEDTQFGPFVTGINGQAAGTEYFWKLQVNGQDAQVGAGELQTKNGDLIEWKMEKIVK